MKRNLLSLFVTVFLSMASAFASEDAPCGNGNYTAKPIVKLSYMGFTVCSVLPTAYLTLKQAIEAGMLYNKKAASNACENWSVRLGQMSKPIVQSKIGSAAILQKFSCQLR